MDYLSNNILSNYYYNYIKLYYTFENKFENLYARDKLLNILDPYLYISQGFRARYREETYKFIKTKYKLFMIKELLNDNTISILQYKPFLSYFFQTYEEIVKFHLIDKNKSISILEITNLPNVFEACYYYEKKKKNNINFFFYNIYLLLNYLNK